MVEDVELAKRKPLKATLVCNWRRAVNTDLGTVDDGGTIDTALLDHTMHERGV
jgi:hypothetical protein